MNNLLRSQFLNLRSYSAKKTTSSRMKILAGIFFLAALLSSRETFAQGPCLSNATLTSSATSVCTNDSVLFTVTGTSAGIVATGPWSATYQWQRSTSGIAGPYSNIPGATGTMSDASPVANYNTGALAANTCYQVVLTGIVGDCTVGTTTLTTNAICITVNLRPAPITGTFNFCLGTISCLNDGTPGGTWSSTDPLVAQVPSTTSGCVTGINAGTASIIYTLGGCSSVAVVTVSITGNINGPSVVCQGSNITLTDTTAGVTWSSNNTGVATINASGVVTGVSGGTAIITATSPLGCLATTVITVNPLPAAITGNTNICLGLTNCLTDASGGGTWASSNTAIATVDNFGCTTGMGVGTAAITYTLPTGCLIFTTVTVNPLPTAILGTASLCSGTTTSLSDVTPGGTWSSSNLPVATVSGTGVVSGLLPGTSTITYALSTGCIATQVVTVNPIAPIQGNLNICGTGTTTLTDIYTGGTWSASNGNATVGSASGIVTGVFLGTDDITYTLPFGCTATVTVTVQPLPASITGVTNVCAGATTTLNDASTGGTWSTSNAGVALVGSSTGVVTGVSNGTTTITYTLPTGCITTTDVTVNPVALITGPNAVCQGATISLSDATPGGTWTSSNIGVATVDAFGNVTGALAGTTIISYVITATGCYATSVITVNPLPAPISGVLNACAWGGTSTLTDASAGGVWTSTLVIIDNPSGLVHAFDTGLATITYTLPTGCSATTNFTVNPLPEPITGNNIVCEGFTTTLSDVSPGGTWTSVTTTVATIGSTTGVVTGVLAGNTIIIYTLPTGCIADTTVTVLPVPTVITGTTEVCVNSITALTDATAGGTWSSSDNTMATVDASGNVTGAGGPGGLGGTVTITYSLPTGCFATITVTVDPLPLPITGPSVVCMGQTISLNDATPGGTWTSSNPAAGTIDATGDVTGIATGTTTVSYTIAPFGCTTTLIVTVYPLYAINGNVPFCVGQSITLSDSAAGGTWSSVNAGIASVGSSTGVVNGTGAAGGTTTIIYTLSTGCTTNVIVTVNPVPLGITGVTTVCVGQTTNLTDATTGGNWSSSDPTVALVGATGIVTGQAAGTATITYQIGSSCYVTTNVTVYPLSAITGNASVCIGSGTSLSNATPGGTWSSTNTAVATVDGSGNVTSVSVGTTTLSYLLPTGCLATVVVTVNPFAQISGGNVELCIGFSVALSDAVSGGTWSSSNTSVATVGSLTGVVTGAGTGTATISYILPSGCTAVTTVTVDALASITGPNNVCVGSTIQLSDATPGGTWSSSNTAIGTISATGVVGGISAGTFIASYSYGANCWAIYSVVVNPMSPIFGSPALCPGVCTSLSDTTVGGTWSSSNTGIATIGSTTGIVCALASGTATITYSVPTGCFAVINVTVDVVLPLTGNLSLCPGGTTVLTDAISGGTWSSSNTAVATVNASGTVTGSSVNTGTATITYTLPSGCVALAVVTVNPFPAPITGPSAVCAYGSTIQLSDATPGGIWTSSTAPISSTGVLTGAAAGVTTVTYTLPTGCAVYYLVTVNPLPSPVSGNLVICQGLSTTLTDATPGGTWTSGNTSVATIGSNTGLVNGLLPGTAVVTYTSPTGCFSDTTITVNPNPLPINGIRSVCIGLTTSLTDATGGGVWSSSNPAIGSVGSSSGIVTGLTQGTTTITYTLLTGCINTVVVTVNPNPTAILGSNSVCQGQTITLTDLTAGGTWSSSNLNASINSGSGVVTGNTPGTAVITYTLGTGCIITKTITINPLSVITGTPSVCIGLTTALSDATPGGTWSSSNTAVGTVGSLTGVVTGRTAGTTTISYVLPTGCTATIVVTVYPVPTAILGSLSACVGQTITLSDATAGGTWSSSNTAVATIGSTSGILLGVSPGTTTISYTLGTGCIVTAVVTVNALAPISGSTNLCQGQTTTLSDAVAGGAWTISNTNASIDGSGNITGVNVGTAVVTYSLPSGCTTTIIVTVSPLSPINGTNELCVGSSTVFTDAVLGGTWVSSNTAVANVTLLTGIVTGITPGTTVISYITSGSGCTATIIVTVAPVPTISGPSSVCQNDSIALTASVPGGTWSSSNPFTATVSGTGEVYGHHSGTVIISYSYGPGCFVIKTIIVNPASPILGNLNVCQGFTTVLSDTTLGGTWSTNTTPPVTIVVGPGGVVTGVGPGGSTGTVTYTTPAGCVVTAVVTVNVTSPIQGKDSVCVGLTTTLTDATAGVTWSSSNSGIASIGSASGIVTGIAPGTVTITATSPLGCTNTVVVTVNPNPTPILGTPVVCVGLTTTLSDLTPGGTWSSSNPAVASVGATTGIVTGTGAAGGTATITYTLPTTCITTVVVTVNPLPAPITGTLVVCKTFTTQLSDVTPGGTWSATPTAVGTISSTGLFTGISAGTAVVTYTIGTGCIITAVVTVNPIPAPIVGNPHICIGTIVNYTDATPGGLWSATNTHASIASATGAAFGASLGVDTIIYQLTTTGCYVSLSVTVDPLPLPITGPNQVCVGSTIQLSDATTGGTWASSNTAAETIGLGTGLATGISAGVVTDTYTLFATGCFVTTTVTVNPLPQPIQGNFSVCIGTTNTLTDADLGGTWMSSNITIAPVGSATGIVFGNAIGTANITYTLATGCQVIQEVTVNPLPAPITGSVPMCIGDSITLSDITTGGTWTSSLIDTANFRDQNTGIIGAIHSGTTTVTYTLTNTGCIATAIVTVNPTPNVITGKNTLCLHDTTTLSDNSVGGVWTSSNTSVATIGTSGLVTGVGPGQDTITYTLPTGCLVTFSMTVYPLPPAITGDSVVCVSSFITLSDASVGGTWLVNPTSVATINSTLGILNGVSAGTAIVTYTSNVGCKATKPVTVNPIPTAILGIHNVCAGSSVSLSDTSAGGVWSSSNTAIDTVSTTGVVTGIAPGTDTIFYTYPATGCGVPFTFTVNPIPVITVAASPNVQICIGGTVFLTASGAATPGGSAGTYAWAPPTGLNTTVGPSVIATPTVTTTYTVIGTTQFGCSSDTTVTVFVDSLLRNIHITGRDSICAGDADTLIADGYHLSLFAWSPSVGLSCVICDTTIARIITTTTYTATAVDSFGCIYQTSFTVTVNPLPVVVVMPNPTIVCRGSSTQLTATGAATYTWYPGAFLSCDSCANPIASDTQNLVYNVIGTSIYGCRDSVLVPVSVLDTNKNTISNDTIICLGQSAQLIATSIDEQHGRDPDYYLWTPATGLSDPNSPTPVAKPDTTTTYTLVVKENACFSDTEHVTVYVQPAPTITITQSLLVVAGSAVQLQASIGNEVLLSDYAWTPADYSLSCTKCFAPIATPTVSTTYTFTATSAYGCTSSAEVTVNLFCDGSQVFIPNTFTPNGDGANDRFYISAKGVSLVTRLSVYNRWGELVFESLNSQPNDPGAGWDGTYKGVVLEPDVFVYVAEVICEIGNQPFSFKGDVSIVR